MVDMMDAHIHLDQYSDEEILTILEGSTSLKALITVSNHLTSCKRNLELTKRFHRVKAAFGFHPEQPLPTDEDVYELHKWIRNHQHSMIAIGEVGLPFYLRKEKGESPFPMNKYIELLESFIMLGKEFDKPIVLHAVYDDAAIACDLLEKHSYKSVHFHWFKGDLKTIQRLVANGYMVSITPDVIYEPEIQQLVQHYPIEQLMIETDGPWPFKGPFQGKLTHPSMMTSSIQTIAELKRMSKETVAETLLQNTQHFYGVS